MSTTYFYADEEIYKLLRPYVAEWFKNKYGTFTPPQRASIPLIKSGFNVLVSSPTGSGKTLAAFLGILDSLFEMAENNMLEDKVYAIYISPLRALNNDMQRNLLEPLNELKQLYPNLPNIRIGIRTSDTTSYEKQKMLRVPPHILITTPESFAISITSPKFSQKLADVKWVIVDEIHELANNKRGAYLSGMLELFRTLITKKEFIRVGLSATVSPLEEVAQYLVGKNRECRIIDARFVKPVDIKVITPVRDLIHSSEQEVEEGIYKTLINEIKKHRTTLIFTNTRHAAERVSFKLRKIAEKEGVLDVNQIEAHHSSLSRNVRLEVEDKLKRGLLKVVVSSTSLELGIDIGYIDLVILLSSPKSVSRLLQRIGRAGHHIRNISKGRIVVVDRDDLVECTVLTKLAVDRKIDNINIPKKPLDVLSQLIVASSLISNIEKEELYNILRNSYNFQDLTNEEYESVIRYLNGELFGLELKNVYSKIRLKEDKLIYPKRGSRMIFFMNSGTIPDEAMIEVITDYGKYVGNLEEEFVEILSPGDIFVLGGRTYEFLSSKGSKVVVKDAAGQRPTVPSWFSEMLPLSYESALEIGKFRRTVAEMLSKGNNKEEIIEWISKEYSISKSASSTIYNYILEQYLFTNGIIPSDKLIMIEIYDDEEGIRNYIFHALFGRRALDALSRALAYALSEDLNIDVKISVTDNGFSLSVSKVSNLDSYNVLRLFDKVKSSNIYDILSKAIMRTEMLKRRFRHCAERSFMILRRYKGRETNLERRELNSEILLNSIKEFPDFPVLKETIREILEDHMDVIRAKEILKKIEGSEIRLVIFGPTTIPSPFSHSIIIKGHSDVVLAEDKRELMKKLHDKVIDFLRQKGVNIDLAYTSV
ncbi:ATP-dependent helicase [Sulfolobus sp. A20]|uniref:ATP-dependent helicase n=3 Tax=Sulfolobaceae TaxID=118883 RepID=UPI0008460B9F|nr:ATP-dependent helicase [Sulfolobus sp. A20]TRM75124.1 ATP-dependent helicase [Sulfolobus sp. A20-N-F8]TRM79105.1 ATP-dependent helicase [Sulfolobus sp. B5]TRM82559.1 ATP-dependent helicase [Sulfolobus sp. D5]TRM86961.1 ATP-dependent helicase [Sulfolobus sp. E3]TRM87030.1 ATP-dependent helicase [Sulfolobus sp. C3]TRM99040.1 ATP-dependent helicase [Sulfolobus sp. E1]TRN03120.1 ATP-dependent helicase [Sulfolobus sp. F1]